MPQSHSMPLLHNINLQYKPSKDVNVMLVLRIHKLNYITISLPDFSVGNTILYPGRCSKDHDTNLL